MVVSEEERRIELERRTTLDLDKCCMIAQQEQANNVFHQKTERGMREHWNDFHPLNPNRRVIRAQETADAGDIAQIVMDIPKNGDVLQNIELRMPQAYYDHLPPSVTTEEATDLLLKSAKVVISNQDAIVALDPETQTFVSPHSEEECSTHKEPFELYAVSALFATFAIRCAVHTIHLSVDKLRDILIRSEQVGFQPRVIGFTCRYTGVLMRAITDNGEVRHEPVPDGVSAHAPGDDAGYVSKEDWDNVAHNDETRQIEAAFSEWRRDVGFYMNAPEIVARRPTDTGRVLHTWEEMEKVEDVHDPEDSPETRAETKLRGDFGFTGRTTGSAACGTQSTGDQTHIPVLFFPEARVVWEFLDTDHRRQMSSDPHVHQNIRYQDGTCGVPEATAAGMCQGGAQHLERAREVLTKSAARK